MSDDMKEVKDQLKEIQKDLGDIGKTLIRQEENIKHHIYRTDLAEKAIEMLQKDVAPIKKHVTMVEGVLKFFGVVALFVGIAAGIVKILIYCGFNLPF